MSETSPHLDLPYLAPAQAQKHVTHNDALRLLDGLIHLSVKNRSTQTPPETAADGERYLVGTNATGIWAGWDGAIALRMDESWIKLSPKPGWLCWVENENVLLARSTSSWLTLANG